MARVTDLVTRAGPNPTDTLLSSFTGMVYDGAGNRTYMSASIPAHTAYSGNTSYTYDTKNQLTQESSTRAGGYTNNFSYDSAGNATSFKGTSHTYNSNNQDTGNSYDGNGNPTTYSGTSCTYDPENRMTAFGSALTATYRGDGLRATTVTGAGTTYFLYDRHHLVAELNGSGTVKTVFTWGRGGLSSRTDSSGTSFLTFDPSGNIVQELDGSSNPTNSCVWDTVGVGQVSGTALGVLGFGARHGYYTDQATGLHLLGRRYYNSTCGRFINRDPIGARGGVNLYSYVHNRYGLLTDPRGTQTGGGGPVEGVVPEENRESENNAERPEQELAEEIENSRLPHPEDRIADWLRNVWNRGSQAVVRFTNSVEARLIGESGEFPPAHSCHNLGPWTRVFPAEQYGRWAELFANEAGRTHAVFYEVDQGWDDDLDLGGAQVMPDYSGTVVDTARFNQLTQGWPHIWKTGGQ